jgi:predicted amidophosphoribosyltransferase
MPGFRRLLAVAAQITAFRHGDKRLLAAITRRHRERRPHFHTVERFCRSVNIPVQKVIRKLKRRIDSERKAHRIQL